VTVTYRDAAREGLREALAGDQRVFVMGEDVGRYGGSFGVTKGLLDEFGPDRIRDTPLSESIIVGAGIGAALGGMRPIVEIMTVNFSLLALDQVVNNAATLRHMSNGQFGVPLVVRMATGGGRQLAAQHSHSLEGWYAHIPGVKVLVPGTVTDARLATAAALAEQDPVFIFEHSAHYPVEGVVDPDAAAADLWHCRTARPGRDVTLISSGGCVDRALEAADLLADEGIEAEVVDLRSLRPLDVDGILASVRHTHRAVIIDEGWLTGGFAAEISARIMEGAFADLAAPVARVCTREVPIPYPAHLEHAALPNVDRILATALDVVEGP
jgi:pyruvate dehydrogenase E1 component beta subunit